MQDPRDVKYLYSSLYPKAPEFKWRELFEELEVTSPENISLRSINNGDGSGLIAVAVQDVTYVLAEIEAPEEEKPA